MKTLYHPQISNCHLIPIASTTNQVSLNTILYESIHDLHASHFTPRNCFALHYVNIGEHVCVPKKTNTDYTEITLRKANTTEQQIEITYPQSTSGLIPYFFLRNIVHAMPTFEILQVQSGYKLPKCKECKSCKQKFILKLKENCEIM